MVDVVRKIFMSNPENLVEAASKGYDEKEVLRAMSHSGVQKTWRSRVSQRDRLHLQLVMSEGEGTERDHAVPLDAIRSYAQDVRDCWLLSDEELVQEIAEMLKRCLIKIRVRPEEHATLNQDWKFKMPPGHEDLMTCDVLARYELVYPEQIVKLREQLTSARLLQ